MNADLQLQLAIPARKDSYMQDSFYQLLEEFDDLSETRHLLQQSPLDPAVIVLEYARLSNEMRELQRVIALAEHDLFEIVEGE